MSGVLDWNFLNEKEIEKIFSKTEILVWAPREISIERFWDLANKLSGKKIIWGIAKEEYISGLEDSLPFKTFQPEVKKVDFPNLTFLRYFQRDLKFIIKKVKPKISLLINGSWHKSIHLNENFWEIIKLNLKYKFVSPFLNLEEAKIKAEFYREKFLKNQIYSPEKLYSDSEIFQIVKEKSKESFDWNYQVGTALVKENKILALEKNTVLPYETCSAHLGSEREKNFSSPGDLNHFDTIHAEMKLLTNCLENKISLKGKTLYVNVSPCSHCATVLAQTGLKEVKFINPHQNKFAFDIFNDFNIKLNKYDETS